LLIEETISKTEDGRARVDQLAAAIHRITEDVGKVKGLVDDVDQGSQEQGRGIEHIGSTIAQMDLLTQQTAASAEENAATAEQLNAQSMALENLVRRLGTILGGVGQATPANALVQA
jgi:methyl-accepting chemotaxis protein